MVVRKITINNSVRYIPKSEQTRKTKQNTIKKKSILRKEKKFSQKKIR